MTLTFEGSLMLTDVFSDADPQVREQLNQMVSHAHKAGLSGVIAQPHLTLLSFRDLKPLRKRMELSNRAFKEWIRLRIPTLPAPPQLTVDMDYLFLVETNEKASAYLLLTENASLLKWRENVAAQLGVMTKDIDASRFLHISIANITGNSHDSVANPSEGTVFLLKPQRHEEFPAFDFTDGEE